MEFYYCHVMSYHVTLAFHLSLSLGILLEMLVTGLQYPAETIRLYWQIRLLNGKLLTPRAPRLTTHTYHLRLLYEAVNQTPHVAVNTILYILAYLHKPKLIDSSPHTDRRSPADLGLDSDLFSPPQS